jgi:hypothetical protein
MSEHPAVAYLRNAHARAEGLARAAAEETGLVWSDGGKYGESVYVDDSGAPVAVGPWSCPIGDGVRGLIALHSPDAVLARVTAERAILAEHAPTWPSGEPEYGHHHETVIGEHGRTRYVEVRDDEPTPPYWCACCSAMAPCRTVLAVAAGWGWTEET